MKIISWNINGIKTSLPYVGRLLAKEDPDVVFLSEIKVGARTLSKLDKSVIPSSYTVFWNPCQKGGSHGTAMIVKAEHEPALLMEGLARPTEDERKVLVEDLCEGRPIFEEDVIVEAHMREGRLLAVHLKANDLVVVGTYVPNVGEPPAMPRLGYRVRQWDPDLAVALEGFIEKHGPKLVWCGDLNVAQHPIDVYDPVKQKGKGCFTVEERGCFQAMCERIGLTDTYRHTYPKGRDFSFYSYRFASVSTHRGWRLDYIMASGEMMKGLKDAFIITDVDARLESPPNPKGGFKRISDHLPIGAIFL